MNVAAAHTHTHTTQHTLLVKIHAGELGLLFVPTEQSLSQSSASWQSRATAEFAHALPFVLALCGCEIDDEVVGAFPGLEAPFIDTRLEICVLIEDGGFGGVGLGEDLKAAVEQIPSTQSILQSGERDFRRQAVEL